MGVVLYVHQHETAGQSYVGGRYMDLAPKNAGFHVYARYNGYARGRTRHCVRIGLSRRPDTVFLDVLDQDPPERGPELHVVCDQRLIYAPLKRGRRWVTIPWPSEGVTWIIPKRVFLAPPRWWWDQIDAIEGYTNSNATPAS